MTPDQLRARTDKLSVDIIHFCRSLPPDPFTRKLALQLHDAGTSVASNYHAACRAQSRAQFTAKLSISLEEADECVGWLHKLSVTGQARGATLANNRQCHHPIRKLLIINSHQITQFPISNVDSPHSQPTC